MATHSQVVVLGGGPGGYAAAFLAADLGMQVTLVDLDPELGGTCLLRGCIPSKALLHVAKVLSEAREMAEWGIDFGTPTIDVNKVRAKKEKIIGNLTGGLKVLAKKRNVTLINARGVFEDSTTLRLEGGDAGENDRLTFDHCIVATGSRPAMPTIFQLESDRILDSSGALALPDIPKRLLVIGGGYIGLEMGTVYAELGSDVTVVEMTPSLLPGVDRDLVKPLEKRLKTVMHDIWLETRVAEVRPDDAGVSVVVERDKKMTRHEFDRVLVAVGRQPNSGGLGLEHTRVQLDAQGFIKVDDQQFTHDPHILAIGDVVGNPMLAHKAAHEGKVAAEALHGGPAAFDKVAIPAVVFTDPEIAWAGLTEMDAKARNLDVQIALYPWAASGRAQALSRTEGLTKIIVDPDTERVLGVGIVGNGAGEMIAEAVLAVEMGCTVRDVSESIHPHPTMSETVANAGEVHLGVATEIYKPKR